MSAHDNDNSEMILGLWAQSIELETRHEHDEGYCDHIAQEYIGFTERYEFCIRCDAKKIDGVWRNKPSR